MTLRSFFFSVLFYIFYPSHLPCIYAHVFGWFHLSVSMNKQSLSSKTIEPFSTGQNEKYETESWKDIEGGVSIVTVRSVNASQIRLEHW